MITFGGIQVLALTQVPALKHAAKCGMLMQCADGLVWQCYPILASFMADYKEQTVLIGVKLGQHCTICHVLPQEYSDLLSTMSNKWPRQTH